MSYFETYVLGKAANEASKDFGAKRRRDVSKSTKRARKYRSKDNGNTRDALLSKEKESEEEILGDWVDCWNCIEGLTGHDCGEDTCCCLHPEDNVVCDICNGEGGWRKP